MESFDTYLRKVFVAGVGAADIGYEKLGSFVDECVKRGEVTAEVTSAHALTDAQIDQLKQKLTAREGRTVKLTTKVDPDLLGGLVVTVGSKRIDGSIRTRLNSLAQAMKG